MLAYSTSKAAVIGLTKVIGKECAEDGDICVNAVAPAVVQTAMVDAMPDAQASHGHGPTWVRCVVHYRSRLLESCALLAGQVHDRQDTKEAHVPARGGGRHRLLRGEPSVLLHHRVHLRRHWRPFYILRWDSEKGACDTNLYRREPTRKRLAFP